MLQKMRENLKGTVAVVIIGFMMVPFVFFGIDFLAPPTGQEQEVAEVNGNALTAFQLQNEIARERNRLTQQFGDNLPEQFLSDANLREPALERLIQRELLKGAAQEGDMTASPAEIENLVRSAPEFQVDGRYSPDLYVQFLRARQMSHAQFMALNIEDRVLNQLVSGVVASDFVTDKELERVVALSQQKRDFHYLTIPAGPIAEDIEISDEDAKAFYEENTADFLAPEQVRIQFIQLSLADIADQIEISEEEVREAYDAEIANFDASEERHAAHILIEPEEDGGEQAVVEEIQAKLAAGEDFAALAEEYSDDLGSKSSGGDLGFTRGDTFPEEFETALASLEAGEVSEPVQTESGTHLIKLLEVRGAEPPSFEEDRARLERALKDNEARNRLVELSQQLEDLSYTAQDLAPVAETMGLEVQNAGPFSRDGGMGLASEPAVVEAAFSDDVLEAGNTSPLLELAGERRVVLRVTEHLEARTLGFEEVKTEIVRELTRQRAQEQLAELGKEVEEEVRGSGNLEEVAKARGYEWQASPNTQRSDAKVPREVLRFAFSLPQPATTEETVVGGTYQASGDYAVVRLNSVEPGSIETLSEMERSNMRERLAQMEGESSFAAFQAHLEKSADIERVEVEEMN